MGHEIDPTRKTNFFPQLKGMSSSPIPTDLRDKLFKKLKGLYRIERGGEGFVVARTKAFEGEALLVLEAISEQRRENRVLVLGAGFEIERENFE